MRTLRSGNEMPVGIVSFPRSGQHLFKRVFRHYCKNVGVGFSYCEHYKAECACRKTPCAHNCKFQKQHDFDLDMAVRDDFRYIILYRQNVLSQLEAYFRYHYKVELKNKKDPDYSKSEVREHLLTFMRSKSQYYMGFINKWVLTHRPNVMKIEYDSLIQNPSIILDAYKFAMPNVNHDLDKKILDSFLKNEPVKRLHNFVFTF